MPPLAADCSPAGTARLSGVLGPNSVVGTATTKKQRVYIGGALGISVRHKMTAAPTGTPDLNIRGLAGDATMDEANAATASATAAVTAPVSATEVTTDFVPKGESFIEVEVVSAGGETATIQYIDILTRRA